MIDNFQKDIQEIVNEIQNCTNIKELIGTMRLFEYYLIEELKKGETKTNLFKM